MGSARGTVERGIIREDVDNGMGRETGREDVKGGRGDGAI